MNFETESFFRCLAPYKYDSILISIFWHIFSKFTTWLLTNYAFLLSCRSVDFFFFRLPWSDGFFFFSSSLLYFLISWFFNPSFCFPTFSCSAFLNVVSVSDGPTFLMNLEIYDAQNYKNSNHFEQFLKMKKNRQLSSPVFYSYAAFLYSRLCSSPNNLILVFSYLSWFYFFLVFFSLLIFTSLSFFIEKWIRWKLLRSD